MQENIKTNEIKTEEKKTIKIRTRAVLVLIFIVIIGIISYISYRGNYLETIEIGENFKQVFMTNLKYQYATIAVNFIVLYIALTFTNKSIKKGLKEFFSEEKKEMPKLPSKSIAFILSVIISIIASIILKEQVALFANKAWFGIDDPVFGMDLGFFIFEQPLIQMLIIYFIALIVGMDIYIAIYYIIIFNKYFDGVNAQTLKKSKFFKQLINSVIILSFGFAAYILVTTLGIVNDKFLILKDDAGTAIYGAGITDVTIKLWGYRLLSIVIIASVYRAVTAFKEKKNKKVITSILIVPAYLLVLFFLMVGFNLIYINTNELDKEKKYLAYNIENTKTAYGIKTDEIDIVDTEEISGLEEIEKNSELIDNIVVVNKDITLKTVGITQTSTGYYTFRNANIGKYTINGQDKLAYISPREIISGGDRTYNNKTYEYTHGFGAVITSATSTDEAGNVEYIQKDFASKNSPIKITEPRIYFGLETNNTIVTNTENKAEFDYPTTTSQSAEYQYEGNAGLKLNFFDRIIMAVKQKDINLAFSSNMTDNSKILINRNIVTRAKTIMPYLIYDENPYMVVTNEGKLVWVLDAYTVTDKYPYSQHTIIEHDGIREQINYIRNSVKVLVDAYDGTMSFYITDKSDPIIMAYRNIYPDLFMELDEKIPEDISSHFVYPEFLYNIQASMLERYHNVSTDVLYRSDDVWEIAKTANGTNSSSKGTKQEPYYTMLKAINKDKYELGLVEQYTQLDKQSLRAYLVGICDEYGNSKLTLYKFSQDSNVIGPMQLETQLNQDETISKELETLNVSGTKTIKNMIAVPINNTVLYVEPIYQVSLNEAKSTPVLKKVVVAIDNKVAIGDTLKVAIKNLLSQSAVNIEVENTDTIDDLVDAIIKANTNLETSSNNNDWEMIGKDLKKLQELIDKLEILQLEKKKEEEKNKLENKTNNTILSTQIENTIL